MPLRLPAVSRRVHQGKVVFDEQQLQIELFHHGCAVERVLLGERNDHDVHFGKRQVAHQPFVPGLRKNSDAVAPSKPHSLESPHSRRGIVAESFE